MVTFGKENDKFLKAFPVNGKNEYVLKSLITTHFQEIFQKQVRHSGFSEVMVLISWHGIDLKTIVFSSAVIWAQSSFKFFQVFGWCYEIYYILIQSQMPIICIWTHCSWKFWRIFTNYCGFHGDCFSWQCIYVILVLVSDPYNDFWYT